MDEQRIYEEELKHGDERLIAAEFGASAAYVSKAMSYQGESPAARYVRWFRAILRRRPKAATRLHDWVERQIRAEFEAEQADLETWDTQVETLRITREMHEGLEALLRRASTRELRREMIHDIRHELARWERHLDALERGREVAEEGRSKW